MDLFWSLCHLSLGPAMCTIICAKLWASGLSKNLQPNWRVFLQLDLAALAACSPCFFVPPTKLPADPAPELLIMGLNPWSAVGGVPSRMATQVH